MNNVGKDILKINPSVRFKKILMIIFHQKWGKVVGKCLPLRPVVKPLASTGPDYKFVPYMDSVNSGCSDYRYTQWIGVPMEKG